MSTDDAALIEAWRSGDPRAADVLLRRFSETRRRHPLAPAESPEEGIQRESDLLGPIKARADMLLDTSEMTIDQAVAAAVAEVDRAKARLGAL